VATDRRGQEVTVHAVFVRVDRRAAILREDLSDGTVRITEIDDLGAGGQAGLGLEGRLKVRGIDLGGGGQLQAQALARLGHSRSFHVQGDRAADRLVERLIHGSPATMVLDLPLRLAKRALGIDDGLPPADIVTFTAGGYAGATAQLGGGTGSADLEGALRASIGGRLDRRNGRRTLFFELGGEAAGLLRGAVARGRLAGDGGLGVALTYDRDRRPLQLAVSAAGDAAGSLIAAPGAPGRGRLSLGGARRLEVESRLDLTNGDNAGAVARLIGALDPRAPRPRRAVSAARDLAGRLAREGDLDVRSYSARSSAEGISADAALGAKLGGGVELTRSSTRLLAAWNRPAGGLWERRLDCAPRRAVVS
jgi:hypothetical protein